MRSGARQVDEALARLEVGDIILEQSGISNERRFRPESAQ
jgi:hypothetical protein